jgi:hypothetical protein
MLSRSHCGTWQHYRRTGCRCTACRSANASYQAHRATLTATDAAPIAQHLAQLRALGLGTRRLAQLSGVSRNVILAILTGRLATVRPSIATRLHAIRPSLARGASVPGTVTHRSIDSLEREGFTRQDIARRLGRRSQQLQLNRRVRVLSALRVATLYTRLTGEAV